MFIKVTDKDELTLGGCIAPDQSGQWFEYKGNVPEAPKLIWDADTKTIIEDVSYIDDLKKTALNKLDTEFAKELGTLVSEYNPLERETWSLQESEARALKVDTTAHTALLDAIAVSRGIDKADLANRIVNKADAFATASGSLIGKRQLLELRLSEAAIDDIESIVW